MPSYFKLLIYISMMFMFPEPNRKEYRLRRVTLNTISSELFTPDAFPRCSQSNLGFYSYPLQNTSNEYDVKKVKDVILDKWTQDAKAWWVGKPGEHAKIMFDLTMNSKSHDEIDPRYKRGSSIFSRSYQYEQDCLETQRLLKLEKKMTEDDEEEKQLRQHKIKDACICEDDVLKKDEDEKPTPSLCWQRPPEIFAESQEDPCKRRLEFQKCGQAYKTEACNFYYDNYPPPPLSKYIQKFVN